MSLQKQVISIPLTGGRDGGSDPKIVKGNLETVNVVPDKEGRLSKRNGFVGQSYGGTIAATAINNSEQSVLVSGIKTGSGGDRYLSHYLFDTDAFHELIGGSFLPFDVEVKAIISGLPDNIVAPPTLGVRTDGDYQVCLTPISSLDGRVLLQDVISVSPATSLQEFLTLSFTDIDASYTIARGVSGGLQDTLFLIEEDGTTTQIVTDVFDGRGVWDACIAPSSNGEIIAIVYIDNSVNASNFVTIQQADLGSGVTTNVQLDSGGARRTDCQVSIYPFSSTQIAINCFSSAGSLVATLGNTGTGADSGTATISASFASGDTAQVTGSATKYVDGTAGITVFAYLETAGDLHIFTRDFSPSANTTRRVVTLIDPASVPTIASGFTTKAAPTTDSFTADGAVVLWYHAGLDKIFMYHSTAQAVAESVQVFSKGSFIWGGFEGASPSALNWPLSPLVIDSDGNHITAIENNFNTTIQNQVTILKFNLQSKAIPSVTSEGQFITQGGNPAIVNSEFFPLSIDRPKITATAVGSGGSMAAGDYLYAAHWVMTDKDGRVYRGPVSEFKSVTAVSNDSVTIAFDGEDWLAQSPAGITLRNLFAKLRVFATEADGTTLFNIANITYILGGSTGTSITTDTTGGSANNDIIYIVGGDNSIIENSVPPNFVHMVAHQDRVYGINSEDRNQIWPSNARAENVGLEFSDVVPFRVAGEKNLTALASLDDTLVVFTKDTIYGISGRGHDQTGQNSLNPPQKISSNVGCVDWRTVASFSNGVIFKSLMGWMFLDRGLNVTYIGNPVRDFDSATVYKTVIESSNPWIYVLQDDADAAILLYDYEKNQWHTWESGLLGLLIDIASPINTNERGDLWGVSPSLTTNAVRMTPGIYADSFVSDYTMKISTPWIVLEGLAGYQRVYEVLFLGEWKSSHTLSVKVYYDYVETVIETKTEAITSDPGTYLFGLQPAKQRCVSIRFDIEESNPSGTKESFTISGMRAIVGLKPKTLPTGRL